MSAASVARPGLPLPPHVARSELLALRDVERAAREYAAFTHGNLGAGRYLRRELAREALLDALAVLDRLRGFPAPSE